MSEERAFLKNLRDQAEQKRQAAAEQEERRKKLQPLRAAIQKVDDVLYGVQGPEKPSQQACEGAAAALSESFKSFRATLDAAEKGGALEAFQREANPTSERAWLLEALLNGRPTEEIAEVLLEGDRSHLYNAWQNLALDGWNWGPGVTADPANVPASVDATRGAIQQERTPTPASKATTPIGVGELAAPPPGPPPAAPAPQTGAEAAAQLSALTISESAAVTNAAARPAELTQGQTTNRLGFPVPPCPGCGSLPAASDIDDVCPRCGAYLFRCGIVIHHPLPQRPDGPQPLDVPQQMAIPGWERLPPSQVRTAAVGLARQVERTVSLFDDLSGPLDAALTCARRIADLSDCLLNQSYRSDEIREQIRRPRRDLPHLNRQAMSAFRAGDPFMADLRHALACVQEDAFTLADWVGPTAQELQALNTAIVTADDGVGAAARHGEAYTKACQECQRQREAVYESCNRAALTANRVCTEAEKIAEMSPAESPPEPQAAPAPKKPRPKGEASGGRPVLSDRQYNILEAMLNFKATDPARRKKTKEIATAAEGPEANEETFKRPMADLKRRGLIETIDGRNGGCWLTPSGRSLAEQIKER